MAKLPTDLLFELSVTIAIVAGVLLMAGWVRSKSRPPVEIDLPVSQTPLPAITLSTRLDMVIRGHIQNGYRLVTRTDTTAQMVKLKSLNVPLFALLFLLGIVPLLVYLLVFFIRRSEGVYLEIDAYGALHRTFTN